MDKKIRLFADCKCELSESPIWNKKEKMLYWRGFHGEIYRKSLSDNINDFECFQLDIGNIGSIVFTNSDYILLFADKGKVWKWKPGYKPILFKDFKKSLFNDVIVDKSGRIYCGMLAENYFDNNNRGGHGFLWVLDGDEFKCIEKAIGTTPNGIRFSPDLKKLFFAVTDECCIYVYDYDVLTGSITNKKVFTEGCLPDGIAMDLNGNLWVADCMPGKPLLCYNPYGVIIDEIYFDTYRVISVAFGGDNNDLMFVTTACKDEIADGKDGGIYVVESAGIGSEEYIFNLRE